MYTALLSIQRNVDRGLFTPGRNRNKIFFRYNAASSTKSRVVGYNFAQVHETPNCVWCLASLRTGSIRKTATGGKTQRSASSERRQLRQIWQLEVFGDAGHVDALDGGGSFRWSSGKTSLEKHLSVRVFSQVAKLNVERGDIIQVKRNIKMVRVFRCPGFTFFFGDVPVYIKYSYWRLNLNTTQWLLQHVLCWCEQIWKEIVLSVSADGNTWKT